MQPKTRARREWQVLGLIAAAALLGGGNAVAQTGAAAARAALERDFPGVAMIERGERVRTVFGRPMTTGATAREAMEDWMFEYGAVFGVDDLEWNETRGAEVSRGRVAFALNQQVTVEGGILRAPTAIVVEGGRLRAVVAPVEGGPGGDFAITYISSRIVDTSAGIAPPQITGTEAIAAAELDPRTRHLKVWGAPELLVIEDDLGAGPEVFAVWKLRGRASETAFHSSLVVHMDAVTGEVVGARSDVYWDDPITGVVEGGATAGFGPPLPGDTVTTPLPNATVRIPGESATALTDNDGAYELETASASVDVEALLDSGYWITDIWQPGGWTPAPRSELIEDVTPPASGVDFEFNPSPQTQADTAPVNVFLHIQKGHAFFDERVDNWAELYEAEVLAVFVTVANDPGPGCSRCGAGAFTPGPMRIWLCAAASAEVDCNNGGYSTIISHEYGHYVAHHLIEELSASAFHEGYGDVLSMLVQNTDVIGEDFYTNVQTTYIRKLSTATVNYPACQTIPGESQEDIHYNGQMLGRIWWDIRLDIDDPMEEPENTRQLFVDWTMIAGGSAAPGGNCGFDQAADTGTLIEVLTADDDDLDISNGTPNDSVICQAFADRNIETQFALSPCPESLHRGAACRADMNYDRVLDAFDFLEFQNAFAAGDAFADFTGDAKLDFFDFVAFENEFAAGCW